MARDLTHGGAAVPQEDGSEPSPTRGATGEKGQALPGHWDGQLCRLATRGTGVGSLSLLQGNFLTQESNWALLRCRWILYQLSMLPYVLGIALLPISANLTSEETGAQRG